MPDWLAIARSSADNGDSPDDAARDLLAAGAPPVLAIKAVLAAYDMSLDTAKHIVHRNLPADAQIAAEHLWDEVERSLEVE